MRPIRIATPIAALGLALALFLCILAVAALFVWQGRDDAIAKGEQRAAVAAQAIAAHFQWIVETGRQSLRRIDDTIGYRPELLTRARLGDINQAIGGLPGAVDVRVFDAEGREILSTDPDATEINVADRTYFEALRDGETVVVSPLLVDRVTNRRSFVIGRRLVRGGEFVGIAAIVVPADLITMFWQSLDLGADSAVSIVRDDGWIVARHPPLDESIDLSNHILFTVHLKDSPSGSYFAAASPADGHARLVGYQKVAGAPLIALAAVSRDTALADHRSRIARLAIGVIPVFLILVGFSWWVSQLLRVDDRRRLELEDALDQNRLLLREVHHRVKNNLQTVSSLIRLQPLPPAAKRDLTGRIAAMAAVHEQIYKTDRFGEVNLETYLHSIIDDIRTAFDSGVEIDYKLEPVMIDAERAMVLGLVVTEVVSNSLKHAYPSSDTGHLRVRLTCEDDMIVLRVEDDGPGFDAEQPSSGLGFRLVRSFVRQLEAEYTMEGAEGLRFTLTMPRQPPH